MTISNHVFKLLRRSPGEGDDAWKETGEVYDVNQPMIDPHDEKRERTLDLDGFLAMRRREDGFEYRAEPA
jgi:hypothetical protein